jgi:hypothetical protein
VTDDEARDAIHEVFGVPGHIVFPAGTLHLRWLDADGNEVDPADPITGPVRVEGSVRLPPTGEPVDLGYSMVHHGNATTVAVDADGNAETITGAVYGPPGAASILRADALDDDQTDPMERP